MGQRKRAFDAKIKKLEFFNKKPRVRSDIITVFNTRGVIMWRMVTSCSPDPLRTSEGKCT